MNRENFMNESPVEFFERLRSLRGINAINGHLQKFLQELQPDLSCSAQKFLLMFMSLQDDGNTRVALNPEAFTEKWLQKWNGLLLSNGLFDRENSEDGNNIDLPSADDFKTLIAKGVEDLVKNRYDRIIDWNNNSKLFVIKNDKSCNGENSPYLYATKYYKAKLAIEAAAAIHFADGKNLPKSDVENCIRKVASIHKKDSRFANKANPEGEFRINEEQAQAILRGQKENLIITGGPGTGKTTVVLYILWNLLESNPQYLENWDIRLAAPSGKAADRMRESIADGLSAVNDELKNSAVYKKLDGLESYTLHRLLKYLPKTGKFYYNSETKFSEKTIFVIDEASMIDISMFASFLQAIPEGARVFILGDPFQLPSVEAGAVLGEILSRKNASRNFVVKLTRSNRFTDDSNIGQLAHAIQIRADSIQNKTDFAGNDMDISFENIQAKVRKIAQENGRIEPKDKISLVSLEDHNGNVTVPFSRKAEEEQVQKFVCETLEPFSVLPELAEQIIPDSAFDSINSNHADLHTANEMEHQDKIREDLWKLTLSLRLLSAERRGNYGVENINKIACKKIRGHWINYRRRFSPDFVAPRNTYFPGELLILTQNQSMYKLYNGDTGVVIFHNDRPYLMLKKERFVFYPISLLPEDALEAAFAITIHKSQGSEYKHVTMFLPKQKGHPLLTNQILYTGITRAKESVTIVASPEIFKAACSTVTERETGIEL